MKASFGTFLPEFKYSLKLDNGLPVPSFISQNPKVAEFYIGQPAIKGTYNL